MLKLLTHTPLLGLLLGPVVTLLIDQLKRAWAWLDAQSPVVKQSSAVVLSFLLVGLSQLLPGSVPDACANVAATGLSAACEQALASGPLLTSILTALIAIAVKHGQQTQVAK